MFLLIVHAVACQQPTPQQQETVDKLGIFMFNIQILTIHPPPPFSPEIYII